MNKEMRVKIMEHRIQMLMTRDPVRNYHIAQKIKRSIRKIQEVED